MRNVLITASGVTTVWHMVNVAKRYFSDDICLHLCDTNDRTLVPAATLCGNFYRVPGFVEDGYYEHMLKLMEDHGIDVIVPLIDQDLFTWPRDNPDLVRLGISSTGPCTASVRTLTNKKMLAGFLQAHGLPTPRIVERDEMCPGESYIVKNEVGCGSQGVFRVDGSERDAVPEGAIIQEKCDGDDCEITAEIFNRPGRLAVFCRRRLATKAGVCTKMEPVDEPEIRDYIETLVNAIECPTAFCAQFLKHRGRWCMIDCNLRIGAGTALSSAAGFQLVRAFWASLCGREVPEAWLTPRPEVKKVLRVYEEIVIE